MVVGMSTAIGQLVEMTRQDLGAAVEMIQRPLPVVRDGLGYLQNS